MEKTAELQQKGTTKLRLSEIVPKKRENEFTSTISPKDQIADSIRKELAKKGLTEAKFQGLNAAIDEISKELAKNQQNKKIADVINAFSEIANSRNQLAWLAFTPLTNPDIAKLFVSNPQAFSEIAKAIGRSTDDAFNSLSNPIIAKLFVSNPQKLINAFSGIKKATEAVWAETEAFNSLSNPIIANFFVSNPAKLIKAFSEIAKATGESAGWAFNSLTNPDIAKLLVSDPAKLINLFSQIEKVTGSSAGDALFSLTNPDIAKLLVSDPTKLINLFAQIAKTNGEAAWAVFKSLTNPDIAKLLVSDPTKLINAFSVISKATGNLEKGSLFTAAEAALTSFSNPSVAKLFALNPEAFSEIARATGASAWKAFDCLPKPEIYGFFKDYCQHKVNIKILLLHIKTENSYAIELGGPLDDLHDNNPDLVKYYGTNRAGYLKRLGKEDVLALLSSDPSFFYTSSNHMLFDRLLSDFKGRSIVDVMKEYGLWGTPAGRNFIFRAMNYGRLYGSQNSMFSEKDMGAVMKELTTPLSQDGFDPNYFYLLANTIEHLDVAKKNYVRIKLAKAMANIIIAREFPTNKAWADKKYKAIVFLDDMIDNPQKRPVGKFDASKYKGTDGKLLIVQVFDKQDTEKTSWLSSQDWWSRYLKVQPKKGANGELIYEAKDVRMVLYMGNTPDDNQKFISRMLTEKKNAIITFRGHSYSLSENFPNDIFKPFSKSSILFMPGSCGSAGSIPGYLSSNQNIDIVGNTSTGDGKDTKKVMELLIEEARSNRKRGYNEIIQSKSGAARIKAVGGDAETLRAATWGDFLLKSVYGKGQR